MSLIVLCPTRGRPEKALETYEAFLETRGNPDSYTQMLFVVDEDDHSYDASAIPWQKYSHSGGMGAALNAAADQWALVHDVVGFIGDDHRFRTKGWDAEIENALEENGGGIAFGNDKARNDIPTQVFISSKIVMALGWMALPGATHLYLDNTWAALGNGAGCLIYLPDVIIEHMHPFFGKAQMDEGYARVNDASMYEHDLKVFQYWQEKDADHDIEIVREALG